MPGLSSETRIKGLSTLNHMGPETLALPCPHFHRPQILNRSFKRFVLLSACFVLGFPAFGVDDNLNWKSRNFRISTGVLAVTSTAPKHWMLDKLGGVFAVRPRSGPHKLRECLPINLFLRNRLKVIKVDGKIRTDHKFPAGFMDVITIERTNETFRLLYDVKGRYTVHRITAAEGQFKLCKVKALHVAKGNIPFITTTDGRTIRYPDPHIKANDTVVIDLSSNKITDYVKFEAGNLAMVTGGRNVGRVGVIGHREKLPGGFDIIHIKDAAGHSFATRVSNVFVIGKGNKALVSLPASKGIRLTIAEERDKRLAQKKA
ncbi:unnamed protein product [Cylicocyclus nassatus]|uniref:Small ribosomal subunit protein eS4 n=1 Tax=Cylicocyclus nassatus TaxID=53992 RepID=A0AA36GH96_CYLNA|nr:unnamed protein product [Cylicocyclus nassatus]